MYALRERRQHVTQEDFEFAIAKVRYPSQNSKKYFLTSRCRCSRRTRTRIPRSTSSSREPGFCLGLFFHSISLYCILYTPHISFPNALRILLVGATGTRACESRTKDVTGCRRVACTTSNVDHSLTSTTSSSEQPSFNESILTTSRSHRAILCSLFESTKQRYDDEAITLLTNVHGARRGNTAARAQDLV